MRTPTRYLAAFIHLLLFSAVFAAPVRAQSLEGRVVDRGGLAVPGAQVTLASVDETVTLVTDVDGRFSRKPLKPGRYELTVKVRGFESVNRNFEVTEDSATEFDIAVRNYEGRSEYTDDPASWGRAVQRFWRWVNPFD